MTDIIPLCRCHPRRRALDWRNGDRCRPLQQHKEVAMPYYLFTGRYTGEAIKGMIDQLEDRTEASGALIAAFGVRIDRYFMALGDVDFFLVAEFPSNEAAMSCAAVVVASGTVADFKTTPTDLV